ncbi:response regulator transcription factor [Turicimonas muris]|uniref:response regulator transcription factor n=2 Tax=Turicimonas muris TaxID=1796652 RepID=UPI00248BDD80|nr:response regulator [Turicimonas muris]
MKTNKTEKPTVRIIDDDLDLLEGLAYMLEEEGWQVKTYPNADSFLTLDDPEVPGCLILDYLMPKVNGVELQKQLKDKGFSQPVIFLTAHADLDMAISVFTKGAFHLLKKPVDPLTLLQTIEEATAKDKNARSESRYSNFDNRWNLLSQRERQVIELAMQGLMNYQIAERLNLSERTIESHRFNAYKKLGISAIEDIRRLRND